jgi:hypothetical protein
VSEYEESAGPDETVPGPNTKGPDPDPPRSRRAGATRAAGTVAGALTSRTAGWIVAAALGGSLVTLAVDNGTSQPTAGPIAIRNAGRTAPAPAGTRRSWKIAATRLTPRQVYLAPGGPLAAGGPPAQGGAGAAWTMQPACALPGPGGPPFPPGRQRTVMIPRAKRAIIGRLGHRHVRIEFGRIPMPKRMILIRPKCAMISLPMVPLPMLPLPVVPLHCRAAMRIAIRQVPPFKRISIQPRGRVIYIGPNHRPPRRMDIKAPAGRRVYVVVPSPRLGGPPGPGCVALRPTQR